MAQFRRGLDSVEMLVEGRAVLERTPRANARRDWHDERAALIAYYRRIAELLTTGWTRISSFADDLITADEPDLVTAINEGDRAALSVYTDWLLERGDPRGERAVLTDPKQIASLELTRGIELFGPSVMIPAAWRAQFTYVWRDGWIDEVWFHRDREAPRNVNDEELMQHALHAPMARFARWLQIDAWYSAPPWERLAACTCLEHIRGARYPGDIRRQLLESMPSLEELESSGSRVFHGHPRIKRLQLMVANDSLDVLGEWPALKTIELVCQRQVKRSELDALNKLGAEVTLRRA